MRRETKTTVAAVFARLLPVLFAVSIVLMCGRADARLRVLVSGAGGPVSDSARRQTAEIAAKQIAELEQFYGFKYNRPVKIVLAMNEKGYRQEAEDAPDWSSAIAMRRTVVMRKAGTVFGSKGFEDTLKHELSHVLLGEMFARHPEALPRWLNEGLAVVVSGEWEMPESWTRSKTELYAALKSGQVLDFDEITGSFPYSEWKARVAYAQSYHFTAYLIKRFGMKRMRALLKDLSAGEDFRDAFSKDMKRDFDETASFWRDRVAGRGGLTLLLFGIAQFDSLIWLAMALLVVAAFARFIFKRVRGEAGGAMYDDDDGLYEEWDEESMGHRPWSPGRRR